MVRLASFVGAAIYEVCALYQISPSVARARSIIPSIAPADNDDIRLAISFGGRHANKALSAQVSIPRHLRDCFTEQVHGSLPSKKLHNLTALLPHHPARKLPSLSPLSVFDRFVRSRRGRRSIAVLSLCHDTPSSHPPFTSSSNNKRPPRALPTPLIHTNFRLPTLRGSTYSSHTIATMGRTLRPSFTGLASLFTTSLFHATARAAQEAYCSSQNTAGNDACTYDSHTSLA